MSEFINYFEVLRVDKSVTDSHELKLAANDARKHWQFMINNYTNQQQRKEAILYNKYVDEAYQHLADKNKRQRFLERLERQNQTVSMEGWGKIELKFSLGPHFDNLNFKVIENPVQYPLRLGGLTIQSLQEFVCRALESPESIGLPVIGDKSLRRWVNYSAAQPEIAEALHYYEWDARNVSEMQMLFFALDVIQARFPAPIIPRSNPNILEKIKKLSKPRMVVSPQIANFDLLSGKRDSIEITIRTWKANPGRLSARVNHPHVKVDTTRLNTECILTIVVDSSAIEVGQRLTAKVQLESEHLGNINIPVYGVRYRWLGLNSSLAQEHSLAVAQDAFKHGDYLTAAGLFREAGDESKAREASMNHIRGLYNRHEWLAIIEAAQDFNQHFGRDKTVTVYLIEATRMLSGAFYQLNQLEEALPYLSTLVLETNFLPRRSLPNKVWSVREEAQVLISAKNPKHAWVDVAEKLALTWMHPSGTADKSHYAGPRPLDIDGRIVYWQSSVQVRTPIITCQGMIIARLSNNKAYVAVDAATGEVAWQFNQGTMGRWMSEPVSGDSRVFVVDDKGVLFAIDVISGELKWSQQVPDARDVQLAYADEIVVVATGKQVLFYEANEGQALQGTEVMKGIFRGANPVNVIVSDNCVLFQKGTMTRKTMNYLDIRNGTQIEFSLPFNDAPPITWAAYGGEIYIPIKRDLHMECPKKIDEYGNVVEWDRVNWTQVYLSVTHARMTEPLAEYDVPPPGKVYYTPQDNRCKVREKRTVADVVAMAPVSIEAHDGNTTVYPWDPQKPQHFIVAAAFGREVFYWMRLDESIEIVNHRVFDSKIQAIIFASVQDIVITERSITTSLLGQGGALTSQVDIPASILPIKGTPALYGDVIYIVSNRNRIIAFGK
jgi:hypothetical protein